MSLTRGAEGEAEAEQALDVRLAEAPGGERDDVHVGLIEHPRVHERLGSALQSHLDLVDVVTAHLHSPRRLPLICTPRGGCRS